MELFRVADLKIQHFEVSIGLECRPTLKRRHKLHHRRERPSRRRPLKVALSVSLFHFASFLSLSFSPWGNTAAGEIIVVKHKRTRERASERARRVQTERITVVGFFLRLLLLLLFPLRRRRRKRAKKVGARTPRRTTSRALLPPPTRTRRRGAPLCLKPTNAAHRSPLK